MRREARRFADVASADHRGHNQHKPEDGRLEWLGRAGESACRFPSASAMGMVMAMVKNPQGLPLSAFTTTRPTTAMMMVMMESTPINAVKPAMPLISSLAICPSDLPSRRTEQNRTTKSCTAAGQDPANDDPQCSGQIAELRRQYRADQGARARNGREMMAEDHPFVGGHEVAAVFETFGGSGARIIQLQYAVGKEAAVKAVADGKNASRRDHEPDGVDGFTTGGGDHSQGYRANRGDGEPDQLPSRARFHRGSFTHWTSS